MSRLSARQQRWLAVALLLVALLGLYSLLLAPLVGQYLERHREIESLNDRLAVYQRVAASLPEDRQRLQALQAESPISGLYFAEPRASLATAALQQHLNRSVGRSGGQLVSTRILRFDEETPLPGRALQVHLRCELSQLVNLLHGLESGQPLLFVQDLVIAASNPRASRQAKSQNNSRKRTVGTRPQTQVASLDVRFTLLGFSARETP